LSWSIVTFNKEELYKKSIARIFNDRPEKWQKTKIIKSGMPGGNDKEVINISISWIKTIHEILRG
jgi:hypothetical protein